MLTSSCSKWKCPAQICMKRNHDQRKSYVFEAQSHSLTRGCTMRLRWQDPNISHSNADPPQVANPECQYCLPDALLSHTVC